MANRKKDAPKGISDIIIPVLLIFTKYLIRGIKSSAYKADSYLLNRFSQKGVLAILKMRKNRIGGDDRWH